MSYVENSSSATAGDTRKVRLGVDAVGVGVVVEPDAELVTADVVEAALRRLIELVDLIPGRGDQGATVDPAASPLPRIPRGGEQGGVLVGLP